MNPSRDRGASPLTPVERNDPAAEGPGKNQQGKREIIDEMATPRLHKSRPRNTWREKVIACLLVLAVLAPAGASAMDNEARRAWVGIDLFPSLLAADAGIAEKAGPDGTLLLLLVYVNDRGAAENMARHLARVRSVRGIPIRVEVTRDATLETHRDAPLAGVFLTQALNGSLDALVDHARKRGIVSFSPFRGDVERGVLGGMVVSDRILPLVNLETARLSGIRLKPFFLRVAERYE